ncbi:MAG: SGNH/GDSL hydrolase family protein [Actinomycetales bacterium]
MRWSRFVALGDSFTEGLEDDFGPDGRHRGWADRVAAALAESDLTPSDGLLYANLAVRGRLLAPVVAEQVPTAMALAPDLVSFHAGPNDVLRPRVELPQLLAAYDAAVARLRETADVLVFTVIERAGGSGRTADRLAARFAAFNAGVRQTAERHAALLVDAGSASAMQDRRLWHEDRLHLNPEGHARVAAAVLERLGVTDPRLLGGEPGWWRVPLPPGARPRRHQEVLADVRWVRRHLVPWVGRRLRGVSSGDGLDPKQSDLLLVAPRRA